MEGRFSAGLGYITYPEKDKRADAGRGHQGSIRPAPTCPASCLREGGCLHEDFNNNNNICKNYVHLLNSSVIHYR